jgi:hypothetical protein
VWVKHLVYPIGHGEGDKRPGRTRKKSKDLSVCESEYFGCGECVYTTLTESDATEPSGRAEGDRSPGRTRKKPKYLQIVYYKSKYRVLRGKGKKEKKRKKKRICA